MAKNTISVTITGDASKLNRALGGAQTKLGKFGSALGGIAKTGGLALAGMGVGAALAAPKILEAGTALEALATKSATVFEGSLGSVQRWAKENAKAMGLTTSQLTGLAAGTADLLKPMGFAADEAAGMAMEVNDLSGALSAWSGGQRSAAEVSEILTKAMLGERESLKGLGISITEADVKARLAANGTDQLTGAVLEQAKAIVAQQLIMEKSVDAQRAWADGSMDGVKAQNASRASIEQLKESLVVGLTPVIQGCCSVVEAAATWLGDHLPGAMEKVKVWTDENWPKIRDTIKEIIEDVQAVIERVVGAIQAVWRAFGDDLTRIAKGVWQIISGVVQGAMDIIRGIIQTVTSLIKGDWDGVWEGIKTIVSGVWTAIEGIVQGGVNLIKGIISGAMITINRAWQAVWGGIKTFISNTWDSITGKVQESIDLVAGIINGVQDAIAGAFDGVARFFQPLIDVINNIIEKAKQAIELVRKVNPFADQALGGLGAGVINTINSGGGGVRYSHVGGLVPGNPSSESLTILKGGQRVLTTSQQATMTRTVPDSGTTLNVTVHTTGLGATSPEIEAAVIRAVQRAVKRNGPGVLQGITV